MDYQVALSILSLLVGAVGAYYAREQVRLIRGARMSSSSETKTQLEVPRFLRLKLYGPIAVLVVLVLLAWVPFLRRPAYAPASPCQLRLSPGEYEKVLSFLRKHREERVKNIEIVVEEGRENNCLYAEDLKYVFNLGAWGPAQIIVRSSPQGRAVWFESSVNDGLARTFWEQTLCHLSQDFRYEEQEDVASNTWMFFIRDKEGGIGDYSPKVTCPNKPPGYDNPSRYP